MLDHRTIVSDGILLFTQKGGKPFKQYYALQEKGKFITIKKNEYPCYNFYLIDELQRPARRITDELALREYLDSSTLSRNHRIETLPDMIWPTRVIKLDIKPWNEKRFEALYKVIHPRGNASFSFIYDFHNHVEIKITQGKLWPRQAQSVRL